MKVDKKNGRRKFLKVKNLKIFLFSFLFLISLQLSYAQHSVNVYFIQIPIPYSSNDDPRALKSIEESILKSVNNTKNLMDPHRKIILSLGLNIHSLDEKNQKIQDKKLKMNKFIDDVQKKIIKETGNLHESLEIIPYFWKSSDSNEITQKQDKNEKEINSDKDKVILYPFHFNSLQKQSNSQSSQKERINYIDLRNAATQQNSAIIKSLIPNLKSWLLKQHTREASSSQTASTPAIKRIKLLFLDDDTVIEKNTLTMLEQQWDKDKNTPFLTAGFYKFNYGESGNEFSIDFESGELEELAQTLSHEENKIDIHDKQIINRSKSPDNEQVTGQRFLYPNECALFLSVLEVYQEGSDPKIILDLSSSVLNTKKNEIWGTGEGAREGENLAIFLETLAYEEAKKRSKYDEKVKSAKKDSTYNENKEAELFKELENEYKQLTTVCFSHGFVYQTGLSKRFISPFEDPNFPKKLEDLEHSFDDGSFETHLLKAFSDVSQSALSKNFFDQRKTFIDRKLKEILNKLNIKLIEGRENMKKLHAEMFTKLHAAESTCLNKVQSSAGLVTPIQATVQTIENIKKIIKKRKNSSDLDHFSDQPHVSNPPLQEQRIENVPDPQQNVHEDKKEEKLNTLGP